MKVMRECRETTDTPESIRRNLKEFKEVQGVFKKVNHHVVLEVSQRFAKSFEGIMEPPKNQ